MLDRRLEHVVAISRSGSFTAAAEKVGLTQSALTRSVKELERQLGYEIFTRSKTGVTLTEKGKLFVERAATLLEDVKILLKGVTTGRNQYADIVRIGVCPELLQWVLVEPLSYLLKQHPEATLTISGTTFDVALQQLRGGTLDVVIGFDAAFRDHPDIAREKLPAIRSMLFVRRNHPILKVESLTTADLACYPMIAPSYSRPYDTFVQQVYEENSIDPTTRVHLIDYFPLVKRLVSETDVSLTKSPAFKKYFAAVIHLDLEPSPMCLATRRRVPPKPVVRAFIQACHVCMPKMADIAYD
jgi:DNA-binding transcriptional LysR family regulator